jgi:hypothetical protein
MRTLAVTRDVARYWIDTLRQGAHIVIQRSKGHAISFLLGGAILGLQVRFGVVTKGGVAGNWQAFLLPYAVLVALIFTVGVLHAVWRRHEDQRLEITDLLNKLDGERDERKADIESLKKDLAREINHRLSWHKAGQVDALANEAQRLYNELDHMLTVAGVPGKANAVLEYPLAEVMLGDSGCQGLPISVWKFQEQMWAHARLCVNLGVSDAIVKSPILSFPGENTRTLKNDAVLTMLRQHHELLLKYSDDVTSYSTGSGSD